MLDNQEHTVAQHTEVVIRTTFTDYYIIVGISMALGCVGIKFKGSLTTAIIDNLFRGIAYIVKMLFKAFWLLCKNIYLLTPKVFTRTKEMCKKMEHQKL